MKNNFPNWSDSANLKLNSVSQFEVYLKNRIWWNLDEGLMLQCLSERLKACCKIVLVVHFPITPTEFYYVGIRLHLQWKN